MQKRKHNKQPKSSSHRRETVDHSQNSASLTSSPLDRREPKRVRWEGKPATEDSVDADSEDEIGSAEKVRILNTDCTCLPTVSANPL